MPVITTSGLTKDYRFHRQSAGLGGAVKSLFHRTYETRRALDGLDLTLEPGEFVGLLGRNGAGKTTTLKLLCGLLRPTSGTVSVLGHEPWRRHFDFLRRIAVVLGQKSMLWWDVSAMDSYLVHRAMYDLARATFDRSVAELAELLSVSDLLTIPVRKLSLGERMKCELIGALLHQPEVLFLDEPTIGLDVLSTAVIRDFLREVNQQRGTTIILTSHNMDDVEALCERVLLVDHGRLGFDGRLADLIRSTRPAKRITLTYAAPPVLPRTLPPETSMINNEGPIVRLEADRSKITAVLSAAPGWGELVDVEVGEADLDEVMRAVLSGAR